MVQPKHSQHHKEVVLAQIALLEVWAGTVRMPSHSDLVHCSSHVLGQGIILT